MMNRILHSCSSIIEFLKLVGGKPIRCSAKPCILYFSPNSLEKIIIYEHEYKILYVHNVFLFVCNTSWYYMSRYRSMIVTLAGSLPQFFTSALIVSCYFIIIIFGALSQWLKLECLFSATISGQNKDSSTGIILKHYMPKLIFDPNSPEYL